MDDTTYTLNADKYSNAHHRLYGKKGDQVLIISERGEVVIVEHRVTKGRFAVTRTNLVIS